MFKRYIEDQLREALQPGRVLVLLGARRVGKTTLIKRLIDRTKPEVKYYNCDDPLVRERFEGIDLGSLTRLLQGYETVVFDEAQRIRNIGLVLKMAVDEMPRVRLLASGSSSLELANEISEPLTGRKKTFRLYPMSLLELWQHVGRDRLAVRSYLEQVLRFGSYPQVFGFSSDREREEYLLELAGDYLYRDALEYQQVRNSEVLRKLLVALALQIGQEVSIPELAGTIGLDRKTVLRYLDLLEKSYVIFRLPALSRNQRREVSRSRKIYFYDLGIRNAVIRNFNRYDLRQDRGHAWENFLASERLKRDEYRRRRKNYYFWRTYSRKEVDWVEESQGRLMGYEFKWQARRWSKPQAFLASYPGSKIKLVSRESFLEFVI